ncbi:type I polyketide synthase [Nostoc favosum]|uniref:SDR family NAD(P)-dependent oxidoreductase n=1 Tax=Nostoc favosum CHAB5714 TaxID=2780399 RepID=A0ABS8I9L9_9NOSO|nr:type I polyketide synthase [Nostoc favosum]MCC5600905.1 SDR family NAD(P)-dependent oxidoreductase [Nostoc favosum CHAB5714]
MLEIINRYAHGFVLIPTIIACRKKGFFDLLQEQNSLTLEKIAKRLGANEGHLQVAVKIMQSLNWVVQQENGEYSLTDKAKISQKLPEEILDLYHLEIEAYLMGEQQKSCLGKWIALSRQRWNVENPIIADFLDGILVIPVLLALKKNNLLNDLEDRQKPLFSKLSHSVREELYELFISKGWASLKDGQIFLTDVGRFIVERCLITGTVASYKPMLSRISDLLFGDTQVVFSRDTSSNERHINRTLNVVASGFQHEKFFSDVDELILSLFNQLPYEEQPKYVVDMGCGDGSLLKRVYETIQYKSARGTVLEQYPVQMIGVDYNQEALEVTNHTLSNIPHFVLQGDIGNPEKLIADLINLGIHDPENMLHIRSFLDHDRPFIPSLDTARLSTRSVIPYQGVYVDRNGGSIPPHVMVQSLVEHLERWASVMTKHGLIVLEVHCLSPEVTYKFLDKSENLHFDAYHAFSMQHLIEADVFLLAAAEAGLFPKVEFSKRYPRTFPFSRITLNWFEKRAYTIRHSNLEDLLALNNLEVECWSEHLQASPQEIRRRIEELPDAHCVLEIGDRIVGVVYSQKISSTDLLKNTTWKNLPSLYTKQGTIVQLLGINILPEMQQQGLGDQLLEFMLQWCSLKGGIESVVGVTRCKNYVNHSDGSFEEYIQKRNDQGQLLDPILRFHESHGATITGVLTNYRPEDTDNQGKGVLIEYKIHHRPISQHRISEEIEISEKKNQINQNQTSASIVEETICLVMGQKRMASFSAKRSLKDMGLDSLDLLELSSQLGQRFRVELPPTFFFQYPTPSAISTYLQEQGLLKEENLQTIQQSDVQAHKEQESLEQPAIHQEKIQQQLNRTSEIITSSILETRSSDFSSFPTENNTQEIIAIIGMGCRLPSGVNSTEEFWSLLCEGTDAITEVPKERWDIEHYYDPDGNQAGKIFSQHGGFLSQVDQFDAQFFRIAPREANNMDPQQRILMEVSWEALENAGLNPEALAGSQTGVFVAICNHDYGYAQVRQEEGDKNCNAYFATGTSASVASGRVSYFFGFTGPAISVDTACSSSLVALHLACQSLQNKECHIALASGVNLLLSTESSISFSQAGMLSPDGRCKTFDASANGYVRGEGCGVVVLKRLSQAITDKDNILALVRGTAVNQDGASNGLTAPNPSAQTAVIRKALSVAGVHPNQVSYVEAHGTATSLGDPVEINGLEAAYGQDRGAENPLAIASVKTNIGHAEAASGIAGLIKVVLSMQHKYIPKHLHFQNLNPNIKLERTPAVIPTEGMEWKTSKLSKQRLAGVNSFGISGTNAHVILEEAPTPVQRKAEIVPPKNVLTLSAKSEKGLQELAQKYETYLNRHAGTSLADICFTASTGRAHFEHRLAIITESTAQLREQLSAFSSEWETSGLVSGRIIDNIPKIAFLFTGQGSQYVGMAQQLYQTQPIFRQALERCEEILSSYLEIPLLKVLYPATGENSPLDSTAYTQPALFAIEYALAELWKSWGVTPDIVMGHSVGEYVAATVAGVFSLEDGLKLIAQRGRLMQTLPSDGEMVAILADEERVATAIAPFAKEVSIAAINGPENIVISGRCRAIRNVVSTLEASGVKTTPLQVSHAFHSPLMEPMLDDFRQVIADITFSPPQINLVSNVTGELITNEITTPEYWCYHIGQPVKFAASMETLHRAGYEVFLEIGPKPILLRMGRSCLPQAAGALLPSLRPGYSDWQQILESLAELYVRGVAIDWSGFWQDYAPRRVMLPTYPWQRERYWYEIFDSQPEKLEQHFQQARSKQQVHPLLGYRLRSPQPTWNQSFARQKLAYLYDHIVQGAAVYPGAAYVEMALAIASETFGEKAYIVEEIEFHKALFLPESDIPTLQCILDSSQATFEIYSNAKDTQEWVRHTTGKLTQQPNNFVPDIVVLDEIHSRCTKEISQSNLYQRFQEIGFKYGSCFQGIERLWSGKGEALAKIRVPNAIETEVKEYQLHPAILDACFQALLATLSVKGTYLPVQIDRVRVYGRPGIQFWSHATLVEQSATHIKGDIKLLDEAGNVLGEIRGFSCQFLEDKQGGLDKEDYLYEYQWKLKARSGQELIRPAADYLPSPVQIALDLQSEATRLSMQLGRKHYYEELKPQIDVLSAVYILKALSQLGWQLQLNQRVSVNSLAQELGVISQHKRLLGQMLEILQEEGVLRLLLDDQWEVCHILELNDPIETWKKLLAQFPAYQAELTLLGRCGQKLAHVLQGEVDPLQLLFPEGSQTTTEHLYQDSPTYRIYNLLAQKVVVKALESLPQGRTVRILEIGAGTGAMTSYVLPKLPQQWTEYVFTDVSQQFMISAKQKFRDYSFVEYRTLDIEADIIAQGFEPHSFDLILASDVLHATANLHSSLENVKQLLNSRGLLVLLELTNPPRWAELVSGLLKGWWLFTDVELRRSHPCISEAKWRDVLEDVGFTEVAGLSDREATDQPLHTVILATDSKHSQPFKVNGEGKTKIRHEQKEQLKSVAPTKPEKQGSWLIFADSDGVGQQLAQKLRELQQIPVLISPGEVYQRLDTNDFQLCPENSEDLQRLVETVDANQLADGGVVHLWSLDTPDPEEMTTTSLESAQTRNCVSVVHLIQALTKANWSSSPRLVLVTRGTQTVGGLKSVSVAQSPLWGLGRTINNEHPNLRCTRVDLSPATTEEEIQSLLFELLADEQEDEIALRDEFRYVHRLIPMSPASLRQNSKSLVQNQQPFRLEISTPGVLDNLILRAISRQQPADAEVEIQVCAAGLNFKDVMAAMGMLSDEALEGGYSGRSLGIECSGIITAIGSSVKGFNIGDEVIACASYSFSTHTMTDARLVVHKPEHLSFESAATIPTTFLTAYYAIHYLGRLRQGERVLIHGAAGGVGLAAIQLAQAVGAEIFATVGSPEKREFLEALGVKHIMDSRSLAFADEVMERTGGKGVDIVLNSLAGDAIPKSISVLGAYGRFIEIGKRDIYANSKVGLRPFGNNLSFFAVDLDRLLRERPDFATSLLREVMQQVNAKILHPLPHRVFSISRVANAFRHMVQAKHIGKIVVSLQDADVAVAPSSEQTVTFAADVSYLITGGLGGFGIAVAQWLVEQGARHLVLMSRTGASSPQAKEAVKTLEQAGVRVMIALADVTQQEQVQGVLADIQQSMPPLRGIIHAAMVLDDAALVELNRERLHKAIAPKSIGAWNLHIHTLNTPLDFFILFSSVTSIIGSSRQGNYAAANAFLDALAHYRHTQGLPALTVNWGRVADVGYVAERTDVNRYMERIGTKPLQSQQALKILAQLLQQQVVQMVVAPMNWEQWGEIHSSAASGRFSRLISEKAVLRKANADNTERDSLEKGLLAASSAERQQMLELRVSEEVAKILGTSIAKLDIKQPLTNLGLDSLMAVELSNRLKKELGVDVPTMKLLGGTSIAQLAQEQVQQVPSGNSTSKTLSRSSVKRSATEWIVCHTPNPDAQLRLFCFPYNGGNSSVFRSWLDELPSDIEVCAIQIPGQVNRPNEQPFHQLASLTQNLAQVLLPYLDKPIAFYGHSLGALISFELARLLRQEYDIVPYHLFVGAFHAPQLPDPFPSLTHISLDKLSDPTFLETLGYTTDTWTSFLKDGEFMRSLLPVLKTGNQLHKTYTYSQDEPLDCPISVFGGLQDKLVNQNLLEAWREQTRSAFKLHMLNGNHLFLHSDQKQLLQAISQELMSILRK